MLWCLRWQWRGEVKDNCHFGYQIVEYVVQAALRNSPSGRCLSWDVEFIVPKLTAHCSWVKGVMRKCWHDGTALVDNNVSCGADLSDLNWSLYAKFFFILICWNQFLPYTGLVSILLSFCLLFLCFLSPHYSGTCGQTETFYQFSLLTSFSSAWFRGCYLGPTFTGRGVLQPWCHQGSVGGPQHESRQRKWGVTPPGNKLIKSSLVKAKEIKKNQGQSYDATTIVCISIPHPFNEYSLSSETVNQT